jgi:hypothetical protein
MTPRQLEYVQSVDGQAHQSAVEIIGAMEVEIASLRAVITAARECLLAREAAVRLCRGDKPPADPVPLVAAITKELGANQALWRAIETAEASASPR